jgi:pimeloyl-ACP methyl ester carboxylesterase
MKYSKLWIVVAVPSFALIWSSGAEGQAHADVKAITEADCTASKMGDSIPASAIGEPVSAVTLNAPRWNPAAGTTPAYCSVDGAIAPVDRSATAKPINFRVVLPASWSGRAAQMGGAGMNGFMPPGLAGGGPDSPLFRGFATYGSDSGHQAAGNPFGGGGPPNPAASDWALNEEAIKNFGYMQMKKTHDAAMVLIERMYGQRPQYNYYIGSSQGGREAVTVAARYPADYNGIVANVPVVNFSSLMLGPVLIRIQEKPSANWVTPAKVNAIRGEVMRQCDKLDGLVDGVINNYMACRAIFDVSQGERNRHPWASKRCPSNVDPNPADTSASACLTDGQIATLEFVYSRYHFAKPLANHVKTFGMWLPNTDPSGSGLIANARFKGQEGATPEAAAYSSIGILGVTAFLMGDVQANPLDYVEGGKFEARRQELSAILDATNPDFAAFDRRGGKMILTIGTNDTLASPGSQLDLYQSVIDKMGRSVVDRFARFYVLPQTGHGLSGTSYSVDGDGNKIETHPIPNTFDRLTLLTEWVEKNIAPAKSINVTAGGRSLPMCSYPDFPKYREGPVGTADSYVCSAR